MIVPLLCAHVCAQAPGSRGAHPVVEHRAPGKAELPFYPQALVCRAGGCGARLALSSPPYRPIPASHPLYMQAAEPKCP